MKNLIILISFTFMALTGYSATKTAINSGNWTSTSTWNNNTVPVSGDFILIPAGITVTINSNMNIGSTTFYINIYGTAKFVGGGAKLTISNLSTIYVYSSGTIEGSNSPSETISIGGNQVFNAGALNIVTGPSDATSSTPGFIPFTILPVKFISFSVNSSSSKDVLVKWSTAEEMNADKFEIERSFDGSNWNTIAYVMANGTTNEVSNYSYTDNNVSGKVIYYRIKQVDQNGIFTYTTVETLRTTLTVSSNAVMIASTDHKVMLQFSQEVKSNVVVRFISFGGQVISQQTINQPVGQVILNANASLRGNYIVSVSNGSDLNTAKQIIL